MLLEKFPGDNLTPDQYDLLALQAIKEKYLNEEPELFDTKWFDYRHLHPTAATYLYAQHYILEYRKIYRKIKDVDRSETVLPISHPDIKRDKKLWKSIQMQRKKERDELREMTKLATTKELKAELKQYRKAFNESIKRENAEFEARRAARQSIDMMKVPETLGFWKGRQCADRIGMPYNLYIGAAMRFLIEGNIWQRIPRPVHLYSDKVIGHVVEYWEATLQEGIIQPHTEHLGDDNEFTLQCKRAIERWLCERLSKRKHPHYGLAHYLFDKKLITEEFALQFFESSVVEKARRFHLEQ